MTGRPGGARGLLRRVRVSLRLRARRVLGQPDSPGRVARGLAAGFFVSAFPLPGLQIPLSLLAAWLARGNLAVAVFPQFVSNALTMIPLAILQYRLGVALWPAKAESMRQAMAHIRQMTEAWDWQAVGPSLDRLLTALGGFGLELLGPLLAGILLTGAAMALGSYWLARHLLRRWQLRRRRLWMLARDEPRGPVPELPSAAEEDRTPLWRLVRRYAPPRGQLVSALDVRLLVDGRQAYPEMLRAIDGARESVDLETYILAADRTGRRFRDALARAAGRGAAVRLMYDHAGSWGLPEDFVRPLLAAGAEVRVYHPVVLSRPLWAINKRDHRKILVVDGLVAFTGGLNISDDYADPLEGGEGWRDTHLRVTGLRPAAALGELFAQGWRRATPYRDAATARDAVRASIGRGLRRMVDREARPPDLDESSGGEVAVQVIGNTQLRRRRDIRQAYLHAIAQARRYILIENAYFIPDAGVRLALAEAARRGVLVAVATSRQGDVTVAAYAGRHLYAELLASGVRVFEWPLGVLHAKTAVIDDVWSIVGSYNFDHRSLVHQLESVVVVLDPSFAGALRERTLADLARCDEVRLKEHLARPRSRRVLEYLAYQARGWL